MAHFEGPCVMKRTMCSCIVASIITLMLQVACSPLSIPPTVRSADALRYSITPNPRLYAFSPEKPLLASYLSDDSGSSKPVSVLEGLTTQLSTGNGIAVDTDGTIYVVVYNAASSSSPLKLLVFPPKAHGNTAPERTAILKGPVLSGYTVGLALDGRGNFWVSSIGKLLRFPTSAQGSVRPNASIAVQLRTPDGLMPANSSNVALDSLGNVYCSCTVVFQGAQASGVSEYTLTSHEKARLVRSFYDLELPEVPPGSMAIDQSGTIYLASSLPNTGVFAYDPKTKSGKAHYARRFVGRSGTSIASITTDRSGSVYVAAGSRVMVFGPKANGHVRPLRSIRDRKNLEYNTGTYGTLLNVHEKRT